MAGTVVVLSWSFVVGSLLQTAGDVSLEGAR